jgi:hypothetical protein
VVRVHYQNGPAEELTVTPHPAIPLTWIVCFAIPENGHGTIEARHAGRADAARF